MTNDKAKDNLTNVLIIANQFPPMGGSGVQRTSKFVKYLPMFGYNPIVLTRDEKRLPIVDETLLKDVENAVIIRTKAHDAANARGIFRLPGKALAKYALIPDSDILWANDSYNAAKKAITDHKITHIYSTSYPYSAHMLALRLKMQNPLLRWVCDFRDEWTNNPYTLDKPHGAFRTKLETKMELDVLSLADAVISNTPIMVKNFTKIMTDNGLEADNIRTIPNGYDSEDFENIQQLSQKNNKFTVTYTGALYGRRKPDTFFTALSELIKEGLVSPSEIRVNFIGNYHESRFKTDVARYKLSDTVNILGYMSHEKCIESLAYSDCLLLIEGAGKGAEAFYTGKIFEYMMARSPVLAIIPKNGAAAGLIEETNIGTVCDFSDIAEIKQGFLSYYASWKDGNVTYAPNFGEIAKYERKELTRKLAQIFDGLKDF